MSSFLLTFCIFAFNMLSVWDGCVRIQHRFSKSCVCLVCRYSVDTFGHRLKMSINLDCCIAASIHWPAAAMRCVSNLYNWIRKYEPSRWLINNADQLLGAFACLISQRRWNHRSVSVHTPADQNNPVQQVLVWSVHSGLTFADCFRRVGRASWSDVERRAC